MCNMDCVQYPTNCMTKSLATLQYAIKDAKQAIAAMPNGHKASYYASEIHYCEMEIIRRCRLVEEKLAQREV